MNKYYAYKIKDSNLLFFVDEKIVNSYFEDKNIADAIEFTGVMIEAESAEKAQADYFKFKGNLFYTDDPRKKCYSITEAINNFNNFRYILETALILIAKDMNKKTGEDKDILFQKLKQEFIRQWQNKPI